MANYTVGMKDLLVTAGVGIFATDLFVGKMPATPNAAVTVMGSGGITPNPKFLLDRPSIQVMIRGGVNGYSAAYDKAVEVNNALLGLPSQDVNGDRWVQINMIGDIVPLGFDSKNRAKFSINFGLIIEPATGTNRIAL